VSTLYIVATPIGNLKDITLRALEVLQSVDVVACEDTRHTLKLLNAHNITKRLISCRADNEEQSAAGICRILEEGRTVAYASDAGTPSLSDPGAALVQAVRRAGFSVLPIPGPSALATLVSVAGLRERTVTFDGFLSPKAGKRRSRIRELLDRGEAFVVYESPFRLLKLLADIADLSPESEIFIGREMTKVHEEYRAATAKELLEEFGARVRILGEVSVLVSGKKKA